MRRQRPPCAAHLALAALLGALQPAAACRQDKGRQVGAQGEQGMAGSAAPQAAATTPPWLGLNSRPGPTATGSNSQPSQAKLPTLVVGLGLAVEHAGAPLLALPFARGARPLRLLGVELQQQGSERMGEGEGHGSGKVSSSRPAPTPTAQQHARPALPTKLACAAPLPALP